MIKRSKEERFALLLHWIRERHAVYIRRFELKMPKPWTMDKVIQNTSFTNVYRELDKTTQWYRNNLGKPSCFEQEEELVFATICFRWFNLIETGKKLKDEGLFVKWDSNKAITLLRETKPVFTGAFVISNGGPAGVGVDKLTYVCKEYIDPIWKNRRKIVAFLHTNEYLETFHRYLQQYKGFGGTGFMAAQVVCDLKYTPFLKETKDWWSWSCPGPGSIKGMTYLLNGVLEPSNNVRKNWSTHMDSLRKKINIYIAKVGMPKLHAQDMQNCLCEYSKYVHVLNGGRAKRKYKGV